MDIILIATTNPGKLKEMRAIFAQAEHLSLHLISPQDLGLDLDVEEDGETYLENASKKALAFSETSFMIALADDSGLEVEALDGRPGLHSARYTGTSGASDADRRAFLLQELRACPRPWKARFRCTVAIALPDGSVYSSEGQCAGEIIPEERGSNGFGYDPIFQISEPPFAGRSMAELSLAEKNRISHRARAVRAVFPILEQLLYRGAR